MLNVSSLISINSQLHNRTGHPLHFDLGLRKAITRSGGQFVSLANILVEDDLLDTYRFIVPTFTSDCLSVRRAQSLQQTERYLDEMIEGIAQAICDFQLVKPLCYLYVGDPLIVCEMSNRITAANLPISRFVVNLFSGLFLGNMQTSLEVAEAARSAVRCNHNDNRLRVVVDSLPLQENIAAQTGVKIPGVPAPPSQDFSGLEVLSSEKDYSSNLRVVYPSFSDAERGFDLLLEFLTNHAKSLEDRFRFAVREHPPINPEAKKLIGSNVTWIKGDLSEAEYRNLLMSADLVVLPYRRSAFVYRTSSILPECFALKKRVAVTSGTWLANEVNSVNGGWIISYESAQAIRDTLECVWKERESLHSPEGSKSLQSYLATNCFEGLLTALRGNLDLPGGITTEQALAPKLIELLCQDRLHNRYELSRLNATISRLEHRIELLSGEVVRSNRGLVRSILDLLPKAVLPCLRELKRRTHKILILSFASS